MKSSLTDGMSREEAEQFKKSWAACSFVRDRLRKELSHRKDVAVSKILKLNVSDGDYALQVSSLVAETKKIDELTSLLSD